MKRMKKKTRKRMRMKKRKTRMRKEHGQVHSQIEALDASTFQ